MKIIAHRGNLSGKIPALENTPKYLRAAIEQGFDVEVDVWIVDKKWYLGHDEPTHYFHLNEAFHSYGIVNNLPLDKIWWHAKNLEALDTLSKMPLANVFWHENDKRTLTSKKFIWTYPGEKTAGRSVLVLNEENIPDFDIWTEQRPWGICTDFAKEHKDYAKRKNITIF